MDIVFYTASLAVMLLCVAAAVEDVRTLTISNWISAVILILGVGRITTDFASGEILLLPSLELFIEAPIMVFALESWKLAVADIALVVFVMLVMELLFRLGALGGGDCKLILALTAWFGINGFAEFIILMSLVGGILAFFVITARLFKDEIMALLGVYMPGGLHKSLYAPEKPPIPYAVAIAPGTVLVEIAGATTDWISLLS